MIEFARTHIIGRAAGHSAVKAAAYRSGTRQYDERNGLTADYSFRGDEVVHSEVLLPDGAPEALLDRTTLWNEIEFAEDKSTRRSSAQLAKDHIIALPRELNLYQQIELAREFAQTLVEQGVGVDLNVHLHSQDNPHAHLMTTTRIIDENGIGGKARHLNGGFFGGKKVVEAEQLRYTWAKFQNQWCEDRGIDLFVTNNDGQWQPEFHHGPKTHMAVLDDPAPARSDVDADRAEAIQSNIEGLVNRVAKQKAVFSAHDLYRELHRHVSNPEHFANTKAVLDDYLKLSAKTAGRKSDKQYFTVRQTLDTELELKHMATELFKPSKRHNRVNEKSRDQIIEKEFDYLSDEQKAAVEHITGAERMSVVVGFAGTGKSTLLKAAAKCWRSKGQRVMGVALAGIAADGLAQGADIKSRTIHSLLYRLDEGKERLSGSDVLVVDESGMIDTGLMHTLIEKVHRAGAKVVLVGDAEQLQPINAGGPLRSLSEQGGYCEISTIRRQRSAVDRAATAQLAKGNAVDAWESYHSRGRVQSRTSVDDAIAALVKNAVTDIETGMSEFGQSVAVLAHSNRHVTQINTLIRQARIGTGAIKNEAVFTAKSTVSDSSLTLDFGVGDRILFRRNDTRLGVKNGSLGTVTHANDGELEVELDDGQTIEFDQQRYDDVAHGYAMTIHKSQGVTVDKSHVLVSNGWDRHLAYVAMSRHKEDLTLYLGEEQFDKHSVTGTISRARVQESAIDFAQRHGIEVKEDDGDIQLLDKPVTPKQQTPQNKATHFLEKGLITEAFRYYESKGCVKSESTTDAVMKKLIADTVVDIKAGESVSVLAHTYQAVGQLNRGIRSQLKSAGAITDEITFKAEHTELTIGVGDHIVFNKDDDQLGVKKGMRGVVTSTKGRLTVDLDGKKIQFNQHDYHSISSGYAMTLHQSSGVDRARVLVSNTYSRHTSYQAMTKHNQALTLYYAKDQFHKGSPVEIMARERSGRGRTDLKKSRSAPTIKRGR